MYNWIHKTVTNFLKINSQMTGDVVDWSKNHYRL